MVGGDSIWQRSSQRAGIDIFVILFVNLFSLHTSFFFAPEDGDQMVRLDYIGKQLFKGCIGMEMFQELINHSPSFKSVFSLPDLPEANTPA